MRVFSLDKLIFVFGLGIAFAVSAQVQYTPDASNPYYSGQQQASGQGTVATDPKTRARVHTELGAAYYQAGAMAIALEHLRVAISADSKYVEAYSVRGLVHTALKEYDKAEEDFRRALGIAPDDPEVNNNYGWFLCETGKERQSIAYFLNALKSPLYETPERAYTNAGRCALKAGDQEGAQNYLLKAVQLSRDGGAVPRFQLATLFYKKNILEESRVYLNEVMKMLNPPTAEALWLGVRLERKLSTRAAESDYAAQLRSRYPTSVEYQEFLKGNFE